MFLGFTYDQLNDPYSCSIRTSKSSACLDTSDKKEDRKGYQLIYSMIIKLGNSQKISQQNLEKNQGISRSNPPGYQDLVGAISRNIHMMADKCWRF